jgi:hypothetical protein
MPRRKITFGDWMKGAGQSLRSGNGMSPLTTQKFVNAAHDDRMAQEHERAFGSGEVGGDRNWTKPVHATTAEGRPVTISFGLGPRDGQTLVCDGHVGMQDFYARSQPGKGHDHYLVDGTRASKIDRNRFQ